MINYAKVFRAAANGILEAKGLSQMPDGRICSKEMIYATPEIAGVREWVIFNSIAKVFEETVTLIGKLEKLYLQEPDGWEVTHNAILRGVIEEMRHDIAEFSEDYLKSIGEIWTRNLIIKAAQHRQKFEYFMHRTDDGFTQKQMKWYGENGLELVAISSKNVYYFKREITEAKHG